MASGKHAGNPRDFENESNYTNYDNNLGNDYSDYYDDEEEFNYKKLFIILGIIVVIIVAGILVYKFVFNKEKEVEETPAQETKAEMIKTLEGYDVLGKVVIDKINVDQYILDSVEGDALKYGIGKIYGGSLNNYGNLCLIGHNYNEIFARLSELEIGDEITLVDDELAETKYRVTEKFSIEPDNLECMLQPEDKIELTLITCESGATTRLVVKTEEINEITEDTEVETNTVDNSVQDSEENV